jgi:DNA-binding response OmpR family regulator
MMDATRILVIEDAHDLLEETVDYLRFHGFDAHGADSVRAMTARLEREPWHVLVLDLGLPDGDGLAAAREIRARRGLELGIVMTTARGQAEDRIAGVEAGADSYLVKPVNPRELRAVVERLAARVAPARNKGGTPVWQLDTATLTLSCPGGATVALTGAESRLLARLLRTPGEPVARNLLCQSLAPGGAPEDTRRLDSLVSRLRTKVEQETGHVLPVHTFRNLGYAFLTG